MPSFSKGFNKYCFGDLLKVILTGSFGSLLELKSVEGTILIQFCVRDVLQFLQSTRMHLCKYYLVCVIGLDTESMCWKCSWGLRWNQCRVTEGLPSLRFHWDLGTWIMTQTFRIAPVSLTEKLQMSLVKPVEKSEFRLNEIYPELVLFMRNLNLAMPS